MTKLVYIRGYEGRGKEVIELLESNGGINKENHNGENNLFYYYISPMTHTIKMCLKVSTSPVYEFLLKWYTLLTL